MNKIFGSYEWMGYEERGRGFGYFLRYCDCHKKIYITETELRTLLGKTNFPIIPILRERIIHHLRIPKISFIVEWRRLEDLKKVPLRQKEHMAALRRANWTLAAIGEKYELSRQRVWQILKEGS